MQICGHLNLKSQHFGLRKQPNTFYDFMLHVVFKLKKMCIVYFHISNPT